ncbi:hypothetical protein GBAR_LOCUS23138, partial [Geodia barretti]
MVSWLWCGGLPTRACLCPAYACRRRSSYVRSEASLAQGCQPGKSLVPKTWRQGWPWRYTQLLQFK